MRLLNQFALALALGASSVSAAATDPSLTAWLKHASIPLKTIEPGPGDGDLRQVAKMFPHAKIVGVGEATHGSHEFFRFRDRLFRYLVRHEGFTAIGFEMGATEGLAIDRYIRGGSGDPLALVQAIKLWPWRSQEVVDLIIWMRDYNLNPGHARKIRFYGIDPGNGIVLGWPIVMEFLAANDPSGLPAAEAAKALMYDPERFREKDTVEDAIRAVDNRLAQIDHPEREDIRRVLEAIRQNNEFYSARLVYEPRDRAMADNVSWIADQENNGRVLLWAHNAHVDRDPEYYGRQAPEWRSAEPMGSHLARRYGDRYFAIGAEFSEGTFRIPRKAADGNLLGIRRMTLPAAPEPSLAHDLATADTPLMIVPLNDTNAPEAWLDAFAQQQNFGGADVSNRVFVPIRLGRSYNAILFVEESTPSIGLPDLNP